MSLGTGLRDLGGAVDRGWNRLLDGLDRLQRRWRPSAFVFGVIKKFLEDRGGMLGGLIAYYGLLSIFPLMIVMVTVLGFVLADSPELQADIERSALSQFPTIGSTIENNVDAIGGGAMTVTIGMIGAIWAALAAMNATETALNAVYQVPRYERPNPLERRLRSLWMLGILGLGLIASTVVANTGRIVGDPGPGQSTWLALASIAVNIGIFALAFHALVHRALTWGEVLPGAVLAGTAWWLLTSIGGLYLDRTLDNASDTYGTLSSVIALLAWFYLQAQVTILSAEFNVVRRRHLWPRSLTGRDLTDADRRAFQLHLEAERLHESVVVESATIKDH